MAFKVPEKYRRTEVNHLGAGHKEGEPFGVFVIPPVFNRRPMPLFCIATNGEGAPEDQGGGWEHVSVSTPIRTPTWEEMCLVKDLFWDDDDCVVQFHPPKSDYVNEAKNCLHLWRYSKQEFPRPPFITVGRKGV